MAVDAPSPLDIPPSPIGDDLQLLKTASLSDAVQLQHPTPDLQSLQGAYLQNVERLEETAERMSIGSNVAEEIRKMHSEQKLSDSRRSSMQSHSARGPDVGAAVGSAKIQSVGQRSRNVSISSYANSIVEVNNAARYGGYIVSPKGSLKSGSWSHVSQASIPRPRSASKGSRLGHITTAEYGVDMVESPVEENTDQSSIPSLAALRISNGASFADLVGPPSTSEPSNEQGHRTSQMPSSGSFNNAYNTLLEATQSETHQPASRIPSDMSFTDVYNQIASEIRQELDNAAGGLHSATVTTVHPTPIEQQATFFGSTATRSKTTQIVEPPTVPPRTVNEWQPVLQAGNTGEADNSPPLLAQMQLDQPVEAQDRPMTAASTDTYQEAERLFQDFDGAHFAPSIHESNLLDAVSGSSTRPVSMLKTLQSEHSSVPPPPAEGMVYYPAPVPRMLNLPQRLSQMPSSTVYAKRRTQLLNQLPADVRKSAPWLAVSDKRHSSAHLMDQRQSVMSMANMPAQLRASMFFDSPGLQNDVEIVNDSAVETLEELLDASALAPVGAFTDHPIVGHIGAEVYRRDKEASKKKDDEAKKKEEELKKRRSSFLGLRRKSISAGEELEGKRSSTPGKLTKRGSRSFSLSTKLDDSALARGPAGDIAGGQEPGSAVHDGQHWEHEETVESDIEEENYEEGDADEEQGYVGPPTTLLAELQLRKAQQKLRTRTAATAFPNGMHSTLLELDAVAQLERTKRKKARVALAWEDPETHAALEDKDNDDVPLGMLFPNSDKRDPRDLNRPLGLLEKRELEENEPLSNRRNRLLGIEPRPRDPSPSKSQTPVVQVNGVDAEDGQSDPEHEGETLGQRLRRLRTQKELDDAIGDVKARPVSAAFSAELLTELGVEAAADEHQKRQSAGSLGAISVELGEQLQQGNSSPAEEETLGQRRKRLQREAVEPSRQASKMSLNADEALNDAGARSSTMPGLRASRSMADLLQAFPQGEQATKRLSRANLLDSGNPGGLLQQSVHDKEARRQTLLDTNKRSTSYGLDRPLVDVQEVRPEMGERKRSGGFKGGIYNTGSGDTTAQPSYPQTNAFGLDPQTAAYYAQFQSAYGYSPYGNMAYAQAGYGYGQMGYGMGYGMPMAYHTNMLYPNAVGSTPNLLQQAHNQTMNNLATISSTNLLANMGGALHNNPRGGAPGANAAYQRHSTFSAFPTMGIPNQGMGLHAQPDAAFMDEKSRNRIDAWRQGVLP